jgi:hypothetical protein
MKKVFLFVLAAVAVALIIYSFLGRKSEPKEERQQPLAVGKKTEGFNQSFNLMLASYFRLKDALVESDTVAANKAALELGVLADSLNVNDIKGDSTADAVRQTADNFAGTISGSARGLAGEKDIEAKRREFQMISDVLWSLIRTVQFGGEKIFYQHCPMAFDNQGAYWISNSREIRKPYFGHKMLTCGSTEDSVDYGSKAAAN